MVSGQLAVSSEQWAVISEKRVMTETSSVCRKAAATFSKVGSLRKPEGRFSSIRTSLEKIYKTFAFCAEKVYNIRENICGRLCEE